MAVFSKGRTAAWIVVAALVMVACGASGAQMLSPVGGALPSAGASAAPAGEDPGGGGAGNGGAGNGEPPAQVRDETRIVYTGSLDLVVTDLPAALAEARRAIAALDGYVGASNETNEDEGSPTATLTFRIPAASWEQGVGALRGLATKVVREQTAATEVTGQLIDLEARIRNLRSSETALQTIAANAARVTDLLDVQRELTNVRGEIERLDAQRAALVDQTAYGTLTATFGLEVVAVQEAAKGWDPATEVDRASASLVSVLQAAASAGIWLVIVWLPILLVLSALIAGGVFALRRLGLLKPRAPMQGWTPPST